MTPELPPTPSQDTHYQFSIDKKTVFMGIVILVLLGIIASMQFCSNRKIDRALRHLDSTKVRLEEAQKHLDSTQKILTVVGQHLLNADGKLDNSQAIINGITVELDRVQRDIELSNQRVQDVVRENAQQEANFARQIEAKNEEIRQLRAKLKL